MLNVLTLNSLNKLKQMSESFNTVLTFGMHHHEQCVKMSVNVTIQTVTKKKPLHSENRIFDIFFQDKFNIIFSY